MSVNIDTILSLALVGFSLFFMYITKGLEGKADFFPMIVLVALLLASITLFFQSLKARDRVTLSINPKLIALVVMSFVYVFLMNKIGYVLSTGLFFMTLLLINRYKKRLTGLLISFGFAYLMFFFFSKVLSVPLPTITNWF